MWESASRRISTLLLYPEARAAIGRARRIGRLDARDLPRARRRVETLWAELDRVPLSERLARRAGDVAQLHGLRAYDAVHLASAASVADSDTVLVAAGGDLLATARAIGITTAQF
jgi:predicted nucleic acid-binding protein